MKVCSKTSLKLTSSFAVVDLRGCCFLSAGYKYLKFWRGFGGGKRSAGSEQPSNCEKNAWITNPVERRRVTEEGQQVSSRSVGEAEAEKPSCVSLFGGATVKEEQVNETTDVVVRLICLRKGTLSDPWWLTRERHDEQDRCVRQPKSSTVQQKVKCPYTPDCVSRKCVATAEWTILRFLNTHQKPATFFQLFPATVVGISSKAQSWTCTIRLCNDETMRWL